tara:strand:+ start:1976 stop:2842 length:867 start_codon:yes stop_codon:yes gene_type:complete
MSTDNTQNTQNVLPDAPIAPAPKPAPKRIKRKTTRPEGYPTRPVSAFISFMNARRPEFAAQVQTDQNASNITHVSRLAKAAWDSMDDEAKSPWTTSASEALQRFNEAVKAFNEANPPVKNAAPDADEEVTKTTKKAKKIRAPGVPKKTATAFILFSVSERPASIAELTVDGEKPSFASIAGRTSEKWRALTEEGKKPWAEKAAALAEAAKEEAKKELEAVVSPEDVPESVASTSDSSSASASADVSALAEGEKKKPKAKKGKKAPEPAVESSELAAAAPPKKRSKKSA